MQHIEISEAAAHLPQLIQLALKGDEIILTQDNLPVVKLVALPEKGKTGPKFGSAKGTIRMSDDFDAPLEEFEEYT